MTNRLAGSLSPYLLAHAGDPVDWRPWDDEAFAAARERDVPVMLSVGYEACHWCHVMQRESFRDPETAAALNARFVPVKVDRELRPDVDALYMDYVAATTGSGGWPMTVFLTAERVPFLGGTYFPKLSGGPLPSFSEVLEAVSEAYGDRGRREEVARRSLAFLEERAAPRPAAPIDRLTLDTSADYVLRYADQRHGGFGRAPKFPQLPLIEFLTAYLRLTAETEVAYTVEHALLAMTRGGTFDQAGGGLHRYATDAAWRVPHFEKMLTDQGLLLSALASAAPFASSDAVRDEYRHAAEATVSFLRREMALPGGGFCASLSAEAGGVEGEPYTWTRESLSEVLSAGDLELAVAELGVPEAGRTEAVTLVRPGGRGEGAEELDALLVRILAARERRAQPERDTKRLTAWNAIAARGLIEAGSAFGDAAMTELGVDTVLGTVDAAVADDGVLREPNDPSVADVRLLEDAAHLTSALIAAAGVTGRRTLWERAGDLHADTLERFAVGALLFATAAETDLPVRPREDGDHAIPSGASTTLANGLALAVAAGDTEPPALVREGLAHWWAVVDLAPEQAGRALAVATDMEAAFPATPRDPARPAG